MSPGAIAITVAILGATATIVGALLGRRTANDDRSQVRQQAEVNYLSDRLDKERDRTDALETEVLDCHTQRDRDREAASKRFAEQDEQIRDLRGLVRRLTDEVRGTP